MSAFCVCVCAILCACHIVPLGGRTYRMWALKFEVAIKPIMADIKLLFWFRAISV